MSSDSPTQHLFGQASFVELIGALERSVERRVRQEADHDRQTAEAHAAGSRLQDAHHRLDAEHSELVMKTEAEAAREQLDRQTIEDATRMQDRIGYTPCFMREDGLWVAEVNYPFPEGHLEYGGCGTARARHEDIRVAILSAMRAALKGAAGERP